MKSNPEKIDGLLGVLRRAYRDKKPPQVQEPWRADTMRRIRQLPSLNRTVGLFLFERTVWRLAPVAVALIIVISIALINLGLSPGRGVFDLMTFPSVDVGLTY